MTSGDTSSNGSTDWWIQSTASADRAPAASAAATERSGTSLKLSMSNSPPRNSTTGSSAAEAEHHLRIFTENMASRRGAKPSSKATAAPTETRHLERREHAEPEVDLAADVGRHACDVRRRRGSSPAPDEERRPHPGGVENLACRRGGNARAEGSARSSTSRSCARRSR